MSNKMQHLHPGTKEHTAFVGAATMLAQAGFAIAQMQGFRGSHLPSMFAFALVTIIDNLFPDQAERAREYRETADRVALMLKTHADMHDNSQATAPGSPAIN